MAGGGGESLWYKVPFEMKVRLRIEGGGWGFYQANSESERTIIRILITQYLVCTRVLYHTYIYKTFG